MILLIDLDGVVYRGKDPIPGVAALLQDRAAQGDAIVYVTNNSMHYRADYVDRLAGMGAPVAADRVVSSPRATALYLQEHQPGVRRALTIGASGLERELGDVGISVITANDAAARMEAEGIDGYAAAGRPQAVVVGLDPGVTYMRLAAAVDCVRAGALFVATNRDPLYPTERGLQPGAGSIVAAVEVAGGASPLVIGKPQPLLLETAARAGGGTLDDAVMLGDSLVSDIAAARAVGCRSILILTGVTTRAEADAAPPELQPTWVVADAGELRVLLARLAADGLRPA